MRTCLPPCVLILRDPTGTLLRAGALPSGPRLGCCGDQDGGRGLASWESRSQGQNRHLRSPTRVPAPGSQVQTPDPTPSSAHRGGAQRGLGDWPRTCTGGARAGRARRPATGHSWTGATAGRDLGRGGKCARCGGGWLEVGAGPQVCICALGPPGGRRAGAPQANLSGSRPACLQRRCALSSWHVVTWTHGACRTERGWRQAPGRMGCQEAPLTWARRTWGRTGAALGLTSAPFADLPGAQLWPSPGTGSQAVARWSGDPVSWWGPTGCRQALLRGKGHDLGDHSCPVLLGAAPPPVYPISWTQRLLVSVGSRGGRLEVGVGVGVGHEETLRSSQPGQLSFMG